MITYPIAKINLGLNVVSKRDDGYHNLETVFYPVPIKDALEIHEMDKGFPSDVQCDLKVSNIPIAGDEQNNLVVKADNLMARDYSLPRIHAHLYKYIPTQAGMGGVSSDCAYMIRLVNEMCCLGLSDGKMEEYAAVLTAVGTLTQGGMTPEQALQEVAKQVEMSAMGQLPATNMNPGQPMQR